MRLCKRDFGTKDLINGSSKAGLAAERTKSNDCGWCADWEVPYWRRSLHGCHCAQKASMGSRCVFASVGKMCCHATVPPWSKRRIRVWHFNLGFITWALWFDLRAYQIPCLFIEASCRELWSSSEGLQVFGRESGTRVRSVTLIVVATLQSAKAPTQDRHDRCIEQHQASLSMRHTARHRLWDFVPKADVTEKQDPWQRNRVDEYWQSVLCWTRLSWLCYRRSPDSNRTRCRVRQSKTSTL